MSRNPCAWKAALLTEPVPRLLQHLLRRYWTRRSVLVALSRGLIKTYRLDGSSQLGTKRELDGAAPASYCGTRQSVSLTGNFRDNCGTESLAAGAWRPPLPRHHHRRSHGDGFVGLRPLERALQSGQVLQIQNRKRHRDTGAKAAALRCWFGLQRAPQNEDDEGKNEKKAKREEVKLQHVYPTEFHPILEVTRHINTFRGPHFCRK